MNGGAENDPHERLTVDLYRDKGDTSRSVYAYIHDNGDLVIHATDYGKAPQDTWGDDDYEFWVTTEARYKHRVYSALARNLFGWLGGAALQHYLSEKEMPRIEPSSDRALLALIEKKYKGRMHTVDEFRRFLKTRLIPSHFDSWV